MKKLIMFFLGLFFIMFLVSCDEDKQEISLEFKEYEIQLNLGDEYLLEPLIKGKEAGINYDLIYFIEDPEIIELDGETIKAIGEGVTYLRVSFAEHDVEEVKIKFSVKRILEPSIKIAGENSVFVGESIKLEAIVVDIADSVVWTSKNNAIATVDNNGLVTGIKKGSVFITVEAGNYEDIILITVTKDEEAPEFILGDDFHERVVVNWNQDYDVLKGITAYDTIDGELTQMLVVEEGFNNQEYGIQTVVISVSDEAGNKNTMSREIEVIWDYNVTFVGHAGSYYGLMNSEEAFLYAASVLKYQALESDLKQTSDGVFVLSHDDTFGGHQIANKTWEELKDVEVTAARSAGFPAQNGSITNSPYTTKLCTLERYLEICKEYNIKAVIELKYSKGITNTDQSRMQALMDEIEALDMRENVILLGSQYNCLIWTRENGYSDIECQYLVNSIESETILNRCIEYDFVVSTNVTSTYSNSDEWLARYYDQGIKVAVYTFTQYVDYPEVQKWIDKGVSYVTCDWQRMDKLSLPEKLNENAPTYTVTFKDYDGNILKEAKVKEGQIAAAPQAPTRVGYTFTGWDKAIDNVASNYEVTAIYEINIYNIFYDANNQVVEVGSWASKEDFVSDFYQDYYDWIILNGNNLNGVSVSGSIVTISLNGKTVSFSNPEDIKAIDIYDFELTVSNTLYKPVTRASDGSVIIYEDNNYFFNSTAYINKYKDMDNWFYKALATQYTTYDRTYTPTTQGKIQIFFRFQQWLQQPSSWTAIPSFNNLPIKYSVIVDSTLEYTLPTTNNTYTILDEFTLPSATGNKIFVGWFLDKECTMEITKIEKGSTGNLIVYAKWQ